MFSSVINIIRSKIKKFCSRKIIIKSKYVHFLPNDIFSLPFICFMNEHFNHYDQCFVYLLPEKDKEKQFAIPKNLKNVFVINNLRTLRLDLSKISKIYIHSLGRKQIISYLYKNKDLLKFCYWIIWGHDLYDSLKFKYIKDKICGYTKKDRYVKSNVRAVITTFDKEKYKEKYNDDKKIIELPFYPNIINQNLFDSIKIEKTKCKTIQINNSADKSTLEMLDVLGKFKNEDIKIVTILSYGQTKYNDEILKKGKNIFGEKFSAIMKYMPIQEYAKHLKLVDVLILNQRRQQGVGNVRANLYLKNKIYIRREVTTYKGLLSKGFKIFDTNQIKGTNFVDFIGMSEFDKEENRKLFFKFFSDTAIIKSWETFYNA